MTHCSRRRRMMRRTIGRSAWGLAVVAAAFAIGPVAVSQARVHMAVSVKPSVVTAGKSVTVTVRHAAARRCSLVVRRNGRTQSRKSFGHRTRVAVRRSSAAGTRRVSVRCGRRTVVGRFRVKRPKSTSPRPPASTPSPAPLAPPAPGTVVLTPGQGATLCTEAFHQPAGTSYGQIIPHRRVLLPCRIDGIQAFLAYSVDQRKVVWTWSIGSGETVIVGTQHLFVVSSSTTPASGLLAEQTTYSVSAISYDTGQVAWVSPLPVEGDRDITGVVEGPSRIPGHPTSAVLSYQDGTTAFDSATGEQLWHVPHTFFSPASGSYVAADVVEVDGYEDNHYGEHLTGFDAPSGTQLWDLRFPDGCTHGRTSFLVGTVEWQFGKDYGEGCTTRHDVVTGALLDARRWPDAWRSTFGSPNGMLAWDGERLALFGPDDYGTPLWSLPADETQPLAISSAHVLVDAPSGPMLLNRADGGGQTPVAPEIARGWLSDVQEGLVASTHDYGNVTVLSMDPR